MKTKILQADFSHNSQSWFFTQIAIIGKNKFRIRIRRDAYDFQSYALAELWNGQEWKQVISRPIEKMLCHSVSYVFENLTAEQKGFFEFDAEELIALADTVAS